MKTKILILIILCFSLFISCSKTSENKNFVANESYMLMSLKEPASPPPPREGENSTKLIKKGNLTISSQDIESTKKVIYSFLKECNGYVESENLEKTETESFYSLKLNIQARYFDKFVQLIDSAKLNIVSRNFSIEDVSLQYVDDSTRLANKKKLEQRYLEILSKASTIKEMLEIESKLEEIRTDAEVREAQLKLMDKQIAYSEFNMRIEKNNNYVSLAKKESFFYKITQGIVNGWEGIKNSFVFLISVWPIYLLVLVIYLIIKYVFKRFRKNKVKTV